MKQNTEFVKTIRLEMDFIWRSNLLRSLNGSLFVILPRLTTCLVLAAYISINNRFPATEIIPFNGITIILSHAIGFCLPMLLGTNLAAHVSIKRIEAKTLY